MKTNALTPELLHKINAYWRAANYLSVGQIYLYDNPLLKQPLALKHIKPRLLGHWGTTPGLNFIYAHLNRVIKQHDLNVIYVTVHERDEHHGDHGEAGTGDVEAQPGGAGNAAGAASAGGGGGVLVQPGP